MASQFNLDAGFFFTATKYRHDAIWIALFYRCEPFHSFVDNE